MGCSNGTCGVSQLPIRHGERVVLFLLYNNSYGRRVTAADGGGFCYVDDLYSPIGIPIFGTYNDYGNIENVTKNGDLEFDLVMDLIQNPSPVGKLEILANRFGETPNVTNIEELLAAVQERMSGVSFMMVHENIYNVLIQEVGARVPYHETKALHELIAEEGCKFTQGILNAENDPTLRKIYGDLSNNPELRWSAVGWNLEDNYIKREVSNSHSFFSYRLLHKIGVDPTNKELLDSMIDLSLFSIGLSLLRKSWMPQCGAGSQGNELHLHHILADAVIAHEQAYIQAGIDDCDAEYFEEIEEMKNTSETLFWWGS